MPKPTAQIFALVCLTLSLAARADSFRYDGMDYKSVTILGLRDAQLEATVGGARKLYDLGKIESIEIDKADKFNEAEKARTDALKAAALYRQAIRDLNDPDQKLLAQLRAIAPTDAAGKWTDAIDLFLNIYQSNPTEATWNLHPTQMPAAGSSMLTESAEHIGKRLATIEPEEAKHHLKMFQLDLFTKANDPRATALAKELGTGVADTPETKAAEAPVPQGIDAVQAAIKNKNFDAAIAQADDLLNTATGDAAVRLFVFKAIAYQGQNKPDAAASALLRIPVHYPSNATAPDALLQAARIEKRINHPEAAKKLYEEITQKYPNSPAAVHAKEQN